MAGHRSDRPGTAARVTTGGTARLIRVGTASWTDRTLVASGAFYPKEARSAEDRLRYYADHFPIVEVDSTYYYPPTERNAVLWSERSPPGFVFHIKAYSLLTQHPTRPDSLAQEHRAAIPEEARGNRFVYAHQLPADVVDAVWKDFHQALLPLREAGKLGVVHFQFPEWFLPGNDSRDYLTSCAERLGGYRIAVEFRNGAWMNERNRERTLGFLKGNAIPYTSVDMPQGFASSLPPVAASTAADLSYVRFHGRNAAAWKGKHDVATPRFAYLYSQDELEGWVPKIRGLAAQSREVHVLMNNCYRDNAVVNARQLAGLLAEE